MNGLCVKIYLFVELNYYKLFDKLLHLTPDLDQMEIYICGIAGSKC